MTKQERIDLENKTIDELKGYLAIAIRTLGAYQVFDVLTEVTPKKEYDVLLNQISGWVEITQGGFVVTDLPVTQVSEFKQYCKNNEIKIVESWY